MGRTGSQAQANGAWSIDPNPDHRRAPLYALPVIWLDGWVTRRKRYHIVEFPDARHNFAARSVSECIRHLQENDEPLYMLALGEQRTPAFRVEALSPKDLEQWQN